jgi:hypothetical protein
MTTSTAAPKKKRAATTKRAAAGTAPVEKASVPAPRTSEVDALGLRVEELEVAEHEARDARLFAALDWAS